VFNPTFFVVVVSLREFLFVNSFFCWWPWLYTFCFLLSVVAYESKGRVRGALLEFLIINSCAHVTSALLYLTWVEILVLFYLNTLHNYFTWISISCSKYKLC
jgi:hypothetical protein